MSFFSFNISSGRNGLFLCLLFLGLSAKAQLTADFTADVVQGCAPLVVQFTDISAGNPTSWLWDLGNGNTSTTKNPGTIYFNPGTYTVKLVVSNAAGSDSITKTQFIVVSNKPTVNFTANNTTGCFPLPVQFTDQSSAGSGSVTQWEWDFGDGTVSSQPSPIHVYATAGGYNVTLKVTNSSGCFSVTTKVAYITVKESPVADFTSSSAASCSPPVNINFTNTSTGTALVTYAWSFGDGTTSPAINPSHNYASAGTYNVRLIVTNLIGCSDTVIKQVAIGAVSPNFSAPDTACQNAPVSFINTSTPATISAFWNFGDGTTSTAINPIKSFINPGKYNVKLVNNFGGCKDSITLSIVIVKKPVAGFTFTAPPAGCSVPVTVTFTSTSVGATSYLWYFGDGTNSTLTNPVHTYSIKGNFSVGLVVTNAGGCSDTTIQQNIISITPPNINGFDSLPYTGCIPYTKRFNANITSSEPIVFYLWNFGDGTTSNLANPIHTYTTSGSYTVALSVRSVSGCIDTFSLPGAVTVGTKPQANFTATPLISCAFDFIQFTNTSTGVNNSWQWIFNDSGYSALENPNHKFADTGYFTVTLIAGNNGCYDTITKTDLVYIKPPVAYIQTKHSCDTPFTKRFINKSIAAKSSVWDFGDGTTSTVTNPVHTYAAPGNYLVKLRVTNSPCFDEKIDTVRVIDEHPDIGFSSIVCRQSTAVITATNINPANIKTYLWNFGDTTSPVTTTVPQVDHVFTTSGVYTLTLTITDKLNCKRTVTKNQAVSVFGPTAKFTNPAGACIGTPVTFTNQSVAAPGYPIVSYIINYGDGKRDTITSPVFVHTYLSAGTFTVFLVVIDSFGCRDTAKKVSAIIIANPKASFSVSDSIACNLSSIQFNSTSTGSGLTYKWSFGDGATSNVSNPVHVYTTQGLYAVTLVVKDKFGCTDSLTKPGIVLISNPKADFLMSDSVQSCPPAQFNFTVNSQFFTSIKWDFGDGSFSNVLNPVHYFLTAGIFNVKLIVYGHGNCSDSVTKKVTVKGPSGTILYSPLTHCAPAVVNFTGTASNNTGNFTWDFGDGTTLFTAIKNVTHTYNTVGRYLPKLLLRDTILNCAVAVFGADTITVSGANALFKQPSKTIFCDSGTVRFTDSSVVLFDSINTYLWSFGDGTTSTLKNPVHSFSTPGNYAVRLTVTTKAGCTNTSPVTNIKVVGSPAFTIKGDTAGCINANVNLSAVLSRPDTSKLQYTWAFGNGNTSDLQMPLPQTYSSAGSYTVTSTAVNSSGCSDTATSIINIYNLPLINAGNDTAICLGQTLVLMPSGAQNYVWQSNPTLSCTGCSNPVASPKDLVEYFVTGTNQYGCKNKDSITVTVKKPFNITASRRDSLCQGESTKLFATGADRYTWSPAAGLSSVNIPDPVATPGASTTYMVIGRDSEGCFADTAYVPVIVFPVPQFNILIENVSGNVGTAVTLTTTSSPDIIKYSWTPAAGLSCTDCPIPIANPFINTTYTAVVSNVGGCTASDKVSINLFCDNANIFIPNTFTPNNDGMNDVFYPRGKGITTIKKLIIFNRWGNVVFQKNNFPANDPLAGWDGTYKGQSLNSDAYVYHLQVVCGNGEEFLLKGDVTLIK